MNELTPADRLSSYRERDVVLDLSAPYVAIGRLVAWDANYLVLADADLHDFRDGQTTRELYIHDAVRLGVRRNRARVLIPCRDVVAIALLADVLES